MLRLGTVFSLGCTPPPFHRSCSCRCARWRGVFCGESCPAWCHTLHLVHTRSTWCDLDVLLISTILLRRRGHFVCQRCSDARRELLWRIWLHRHCHHHLHIWIGDCESQRCNWRRQQSNHRRDGRAGDANTLRVAVRLAIHCTRTARASMHHVDLPSARSKRHCECHSQRRR